MPGIYVIFFLSLFFPFFASANTLLVGHYPDPVTYGYTQNDFWVEQSPARQGGGFVFEASSVLSNVGVLEVPLCAPVSTTGHVYFNIYVNGVLGGVTNSVDIDTIPTVCGPVAPSPYLVASTTFSISPSMDFSVGDIVYFALRSDNLSGGYGVYSVNSNEVATEYYDYVMATSSPYADGWNARLEGQFSGYHQAYFALLSVPPSVASENLGSIDITSPVTGSYVSDDDVDFSVTLNNIFGHSAVTVCVTDVIDSFQFTGSDVCYSRESYSLVDGQTLLEFEVDVDSVASTTRSVFVWYGVTLDYISNSGVRGVDWDMVSVGFNNAVPGVDFRGVGSYGSKASTWKCADASLMEFASTTLCIVDYLFVPDYASLRRVSSSTIALFLDTFPVNILAGTLSSVSDELFNSATSTFVLTFPFPAPNGATTSLLIIDASTLATDYPLLATVKTSIAYILWLAFGMYILQSVGNTLHLFGIGSNRGLR